MAQIAQHAHCQICGKAMEWGKPACSPACEGNFEEMQRRRKRTVRAMYALIGISMLVMVLTLLGVFPGSR